jgi:hypothetical protein
MRASEAGSCSAPELRSGSDRANVVDFSDLDAGRVALALAQFRHQIPLALARHGPCDVISEHVLTLVHRERSPNTFSPT